MIDLNDIYDSELVEEGNDRYYKVALSQEQFALIDEADYEIVMEGAPWCALRRPHTYYAMHMVMRTNGRKTSEAMHTFLTGYRRVDHRNHNGLDNRRFNLREVTCSQNNMNMRPRRNSSSRFKGVTWAQSQRGQKKWKAQIKSRCIGYYAEEIDAALAYDLAARQQFGEYASLNLHQVNLGDSK